MWNCKAWPTAVDISVKDGKDKLDIEEEKFRDKLDKEKETWHKDVYQLALDFEKI